MEGYPRWSPDGKRIAFIATDRYDWVTISYLYVLDVETGEQRKITPRYDEKIKQFFWAGGGDRILFIGGDGVATQIYSVQLADGEVEALTSGTDVRSGLSVSRKGLSVAFLKQSANVPPDIHFTRLDSFRPKRLTRVNPQLASWPKIETEVVRWKSFDGMGIEGLVHKPVGHDAARRYPLLVVPHGGPHAVMTNGFVGGEYRLFAQRGWVVFRPNFRGSGHYGEKFLRANLGGWGLGDYQDVMSGVDYLIESGLVDPDRMAISGASYGGYMTSWTISQTNRFRAAVIGAAITDVPSFIRTTDVPERFEDYLGKDQKRYHRSSPMYFADNIRTPSLIWHGDGDIRVPLMQGRHLYTALLKNKVPVEFVIYHGEAHGLRKAEHRRDLLERKLRWLDRWVTEP
jgi:dipeptidyl aminopeptidase/acylaminoacyl peptidase